MKYYLRYFCSMSLMVLLGLHEAYSQDEIKPQPVFIRGYSVCKQKKEKDDGLSENYSVTLKLLIPTKRGRHLFGGAQSISLVATGANGEKMVLGADRVSIESFFRKVPKKWAYECAVEFILPKGEWNINGSIRLFEGWDIESVPVVFASEEKTGKYGDWVYKYVLISKNQSDFSWNDINICVDTTTPYAGVRVKNTHDDKIRFVYSSTLPNQGVTYIHYLLSDVPPKSHDGELMFYSKTEPKDIPINISLSVGMNPD